MAEVNRLRDGLLITVTVAMVSWFAVNFLPVFIAGSDWLSDFRQANFAPEMSQDANIVVLTISEETMALLPYRSPIQRSFVAGWLKSLDAAQPKAIGLDILFDQPTTAADDLRLRQVLTSMTTPVVLAIGDPAAGLTPSQIQFQKRFLEGQDTGLANLAKESGIVRFTFPGADIDGAWVPSFAYRLAETAGASVPGNDLRIAYRSIIAKGQAAFKQYPVHTASMLPTAWLRDKIIMIGADLPQQDRHQTPLSLQLGAEDRTLPGIVIHAHILAQLLDGTEMPVLPAWAEVLILIGAVSCGAALSMFAIPLLATAGLGVLALVAFWFIGFELFRAAGPMIELVGPSIGFLAAIGVAGGYGRRKERATKRLLRKAFSRYVSPKVIEKMLADPARLALGGETREMSFIFTDIAGFTSLSESLPPEQAIGLLQDYLDGMVEIALEHDGAIDKFIGDAVMVFFGAPTDQPDHAERAVQCAVALDGFAETFKREQQEKGIDFGHTRIGVHTGPAIVGNIGSKRRFEYTSVGDTVNSAARLESVNKHFGTRLCISGETVSRCTGIVLRPVGDVVLKGKQQALEVFTAWNADTDAPMDEYKYAYDELAADRNTARDLFEKMANEYPDDRLVKYHLARLRLDQSGVYLTMESK